MKSTESGVQTVVEIKLSRWDIVATAASFPFSEQSGLELLRAERKGDREREREREILRMRERQGE